MAHDQADLSVNGALESMSMTDTNGQAHPSLWRRLFSSWDKDNAAYTPPFPPAHKDQGGVAEQQNDPKSGIMRRVSRKVVPGLPRTQTFKRQRSEERSRLEPVRPTPADRRAVSMDRRTRASSSTFFHPDPRTSAPDFLDHTLGTAPSSPPVPMSPVGGLLDSMADLDHFALDRDSVADAISRIDVQSMTTSQYNDLIDSELERIWILNLSMHFRDRSKREKFFVTYREHEHLWRRVTISLDYRNAPEGSLESELAQKHYQRDKSAKIYEAIRDSLPEIQFYDTVTNLKLETKDGRLHVHVVEDVNEIISYPPVRMIQHMDCRRVKEREIHFDSHLSGFVYKVRVHGRVLIKKEIPGPDNVDEFLYEINALDQLYPAENVIQFYGVVVDDREEHVSGLLISYAARGALLDIIYDHDHSIPWPVREKWARQIVAGLSEIHEAGFVQGDFTLSNIVVDENDDAKIIDINRRGCPIGWEPPEATPLIESNQRISMYIGVKSDLYQLGMVLWALATQEDDPEAHGRPLRLEPDAQVPGWYRRVVETCLSSNPRNRAPASELLSWFPIPEQACHYGRPNGASDSVQHDVSARHGDIPNGTYTSNGVPLVKTVHPPNDWQYAGWDNPCLSSVASGEPYYPPRGRSPPSPGPSNHGGYDRSPYGHRMYTWSDAFNCPPPVPSVSDFAPSGRAKDSHAHFKESKQSLGEFSEVPSSAMGTVGDNGRRAVLNGEPLETHQNGEVQQAGVPLPSPPRSHYPRGQTGRLARNDGDDDTDHDSDSISRTGQQTYRNPSGKTGPDSQADSGKDLTDLASTPREQREQQQHS
ncbi:hypothetical protein VTK26DRAFT_3221 [Humicola hyalothermophila]